MLIIRRGIGIKSLELVSIDLLGHVLSMNIVFVFDVELLVFGFDLLVFGFDLL